MESEAPTGWRPNTLGGVAEYHNGFAFKPHHWRSHGTPIIRIAQMLNANAPLDYAAFRVPERNQIDNGDLLFSWSATLATCIWDRGPSYLNQHLFKVVPREDAAIGYVHHLLDHVMDRLAGMSHGTTMRHIKRGDLHHFDVSVPPASEQRRIAAILDTLDEAIRRTEQVIEKLNQMKQGLLHDLLTRGIDDNGELRPPPEEAPHLYKDSPLGRIPRRWEVEQLGGLSRGGISNGVFKEPARVGSGAPLVNVLDLYQGFGVDLTACERFAATTPELARFGVRTGDIFFTRSSLNLQGIAHCNVLRGDGGNAVYECHLMRVHPDDARSDSAFLALWCRSPFARSFFMGRAKQTTMTTISQPDIYPLPVPMPSMLEQKGVVECLDGVLDRETDEKQYLAKLAHAKRGLMDDLLTGRVRTVSVGDA